MSTFSLFKLTFLFNSSIFLTISAAASIKVGIFKFVTPRRRPWRRSITLTSFSPVFYSKTLPTASKRDGIPFLYLNHETNISLPFSVFYGKSSSFNSDFFTRKKNKRYVNMLLSPYPLANKEFSRPWLARRYFTSFSSNTPVSSRNSRTAVFIG